MIRAKESCPITVWRGLTVQILSWPRPLGLAHQGQVVRGPKRNKGGDEFFHRKKSPRAPRLDPNFCRRGNLHSILPISLASKGSRLPIAVRLDKMSSHIIKTGGAQIAYTDQGSGELTLVFLHYLGWVFADVGERRQSTRERFQMRDDGSSWVGTVDLPERAL